MDDTSPEAQRRYFELLSQRTPAQRLAMAARLIQASRQMAMAGLRQQHPDATEAQLRAFLARRLYGDAVPPSLQIE